MRRLLLTLSVSSFMLLQACESSDPPGGGEGGTGGSGTPQAITVEGWVSEYGEPAEGLVVVLNYDTALQATTGQDGRFRFERVVPPYDIAVLVPGWDDEHVLFGFHGLTHENPRLPLGETFRSAELTGSVTGVEDLQFDDTELLLGLSQVESEVSGNFMDDGRIELDWVTWNGPATYSGTLVGVTVDLSEEDAPRFVSAGVSAHFEVQDGGTAEIDLTIDTPVTTQATQIVVQPGAYTKETYADVASFEIFDAIFPGYPLPAIWGTEIHLPTEGASLRLIGRDANGHAGATIVPAVLGGETVLSLPDTAPLRVVHPERDATITTRTPTLEWTEIPGARVYEVTLEGMDLEATWLVPAGTTQLKIPSLESFGFQLTPGGDYHWTVTADTGLRLSPQELVDPDGPGANPAWWLHPHAGFLLGASFEVAED